MDKQFTLSVLVVTYEPDPESLFRTLYSILIQKDVDFEIVIADDGSGSFDFKSVEALMASWRFDDYRLVISPENQGTVKNMIRGLTACQGRYVKDISAGDFLYDEYSLRYALDAIEENNVPFVFGRAVHYSTDENGGIIVHNRSYPMDLDAYVRRDSDRILFNYLLHRDYILGAAFLIETRLYLDYMKRIDNRITYTEDACVILMVADGIRPFFMDRYFVWYETGEGISTSSNDSWSAILAEENREIYRILDEHRLYDKNVCGWWSGEKKNLQIQCLRVYHRLWCEYHWRKLKRPGALPEPDTDLLKDILSAGMRTKGE